MLAIENDPLLTKSEKAQRKQSLYITYNLNGALGSHSLGTTVSPLSNSFYPNDTVESVVGKFASDAWIRIQLYLRDLTAYVALFFSGNALDDIHLDDPLSLVDSIHRETNSPISNSISAGLASSGLFCSSAPVNIPGIAERSVLSNFSPSTSSPLQHLQSAGFLTGSRFSHQDPIESVRKYFFATSSICDSFICVYFSDGFPVFLLIELDPSL